MEEKDKRTFVGFNVTDPRLIEALNIEADLTNATVSDVVRRIISKHFGLEMNITQRSRHRETRLAVIDEVVREHYKGGAVCKGVATTIAEALNEKEVYSAEGTPWTPRKMQRHIHNHYRDMMELPTHDLVKGRRTLKNVEQVFEVISLHYKGGPIWKDIVSAITEDLNRRNMKTARGGEWTDSRVKRHIMDHYPDLWKMPDPDPDGQRASLKGFSEVLDTDAF